MSITPTPPADSGGRTLRVIGLTVVTALTLSACDHPLAAPVDETQLAASLSVEAQTAMNATDGGPTSILRHLVQGVLESDNARSKALVDAGEVLQGVVLVFPNAATRIANVVQTGLARVRESLGSRDAPRIRAVLNDIATLLQRASDLQAQGRPAAALDLALQADAKLERLQDNLN